VEKPLIEETKDILEKMPNPRIIEDAFLMHLAIPTNLLFIRY